RQPRRSPKSVGASEAEEVPAEEPQVADKDDDYQKAGGQDEGQAGPDPDAQAEDQTGSDAGAQAEGQAGSNPDETFEGQAGSNPNETSEG
nr:hypothetical protein [Tanacetum cinerariifolium]